MMGGGTPVRAWLEFLKWTVRQSEHTLPAIILASLEKLNKLTPGMTKKFYEQGKELQKELIDMIGPNGVMLYPSYPTPAPRHHKPMMPPFNWVYTAIINIMQFPVTQVPLGLNADGLPLGVQVIGIPGNDHVTIAVAMELEKTFGGWVPPWESKKKG
jgi:fatty acid amide hydrolase 2